MKNNSVLIAVLTTAERDGWISPLLLGFLMGIRGAQREVQLQLMHNIRPVDAARNAIAEDFLRSSCEWLLMIDNDQVPGANLLDIIDRAGEGMDIVVPKFYVTATVQQGQRAPQLEPVLGWQPLNGKPVEQGQEWTELNAASSGVMLVRRVAFERMTKPFFRFVYDENGRVCECEDIFFSRKAREAGLSVWGNQNFEVEHFKSVPLSIWARSCPYRDLRGVAGRFPQSAAANK